MKFRIWLIDLIAGNMTVVMNAEIKGNLECRKSSVYLSNNKFIGKIFAISGKEIICKEDGSVSFLPKLAQADGGEGGK